MSKRIKVGIAGARGLTYLPGLRDIPDVEITAFCELNESLLKAKADEFGIHNRYRIFEDMCDSAIDAVIIGTPMQHHVPHAITALEAGKHVLSEVVAGVTMDELFWLKEAAEQASGIYMFCENYCYRPDVVLIQNLIDQGYFGELYFADSHYIEDIKSWLTYPNGKNSWRKYWQVGKKGAFYPTHCLGPMMKWFGGDRIEEISCFGVGPYTAPKFRQEDTTTTMVRLKSGKLLEVRVDVMSNRPNQCCYFSLQGTKGCVEYPRGNQGGNNDIHKIYFNDGGTRVSKGLKWQNLWDYDECLPEHYRNMPLAAQKLAANGDYNTCGGDYYIPQDFIKSIRGEIQVPITVYDACEWTAVGLLAELSAQNKGKAMCMPDFYGDAAALRYRI